jgi:ketosteroid isomerase-like protein
MSQENVEILRRAYAAFNRHDWDAALDALDPNVEWHQITQFPDRAVYRGRDEMRDRFWNQQLVEQFGDFKIEVEEFVDAGDHVVMLGHIVGHGNASGAPIRLRVVNVLEMRDGKAIRAYDVAGSSLTLPSKRSGLSEQDAHADS